MAQCALTKSAKSEVSKLSKTLASRNKDLEKYNDLQKVHISKVEQVRTDSSIFVMQIYNLKRELTQLQSKLTSAMKKLDEQLTQKLANTIGLANIQLEKEKVKLAKEEPKN